MEGGNLNVAIIGAGFMGEVHAKAYKNISGIEVHTVVDKNLESASAFANKFGCKQAQELGQVLNDTIDFIDVCLPTCFHKNVVIEGFKAGKDVICEKPISLSVEEAEEIVEASEIYGRKLMIAHVIRFWPEYVKFADMVRNEEIAGIKNLTLYRYGARPLWSEGNWMLSDKQSGGIIYDLAIHDIDFIISLFGMPEWVFARGSMFGEDYTDYINAILGFKDLNVFIESGSVMPDSYPFTTGFRLSTGTDALEYINKNQKGLLKFSHGSISGEEVDYEIYDPYEKELEYFIQCVRQNKKPKIGSGFDAVKALKIARCIDISAKNNIKVEVT